MSDRVKDLYSSGVGWLTTHAPAKLPGKRLLIFATASIFCVWVIFVFGPSPTTVASKLDLPAVPKITIDLHPNDPSRNLPAAVATPESKFNESKVALLIEDRPIAHLAPLMLHMISVVPPEWRFVFLGSEASIKHINTSLPIQKHERDGKLDLIQLPPNVTVNGQEPLSVTMTDLWFWEWLGGREKWDPENPYTDEIIVGRDGKERKRPQVEFMLVFQTDSILCSNSPRSINEWIEYDWVGAPWSINDPYGGNGGLSLRRLTRIIQVLKTQHRTPSTELEDLWLVSRIGVLPGAHMVNGTLESQFSVEQVWNEAPMGYHTGWSGNRFPDDVWSTKERRDRIWKWCPELKMVLEMRLAKEGCEGGPLVGRGLEGRDLQIAAW